MKLSNEILIKLRPTWTPTVSYLIITKVKNISEKLYKRIETDKF
jgi:hypothetical protein